MTNLQNLRETLNITRNYTLSPDEWPRDITREQVAEEGRRDISHALKLLDAIEAEQEALYKPYVQPKVFAKEQSVARYVALDFSANDPNAPNASTVKDPE